MLFTIIHTDITQNNLRYI